MREFLRVLSVLTVVGATIPSLAHALELPGKMRLTKDQYYSTQRIYYPGFTFAGFAEPVAIIVTAVLLMVMPSGSADFWLTLVALVGLIGMHAAYWLFTHPVNKFWVEGQNLSRVGAGFFSFGSRGSGSVDGRPASWTELRNRWEYSHVMRAGLSTVSLVSLLIAVT
jgi:Domain of unknown function (DUF1772)